MLRAWLDEDPSVAQRALDRAGLALAPEPPAERRLADGEAGGHGRDGPVATLVRFDGAAAEVGRDRHWLDGAAKLPDQSYPVTLYG